MLGRVLNGVAGLAAGIGLLVVPVLTGVPEPWLAILLVVGILSVAISGLSLVRDLWEWLGPRPRSRRQLGRDAVKLADEILAFLRDRESAAPNVVVSAPADRDAVFAAYHEHMTQTIAEYRRIYGGRVQFVTRQLRQRGERTPEGNSDYYMVNVLQLGIFAQDLSGIGHELR
jgi:hypothetical protein